MAMSATVNATVPWIKDLRPLLSQAELKGLLADLQPGTEALAHVSQHDPRAGPCEQDRAGPPDAGRRARDERDLAIQ